MAEFGDEFLDIEITDEIFKDIKYFISGEIHEKIDNLLRTGGAKHMNYLSDYVTHLIVGHNVEENDIADANDLYEIPAVLPKWILMCARLRKRVEIKPYLYPTTPRLFTNLVFSFSQVEDRNSLWALITYNGGFVHNRLSEQCNYLVTGITDSPKYLKAESTGISIVTPDWIVESIKNNAMADPILFHPKLIAWPPPPKPHESTTAITGFEPDMSEKKPEEKDVSESTQALLEKLKQRMPWNQPGSSSTIQTTSCSDPVAPPNVVAPSFLNKMQLSNQNLQSVRPQGLISSATNQAELSASTSFANVSSMSPSQVPKSIVHHTPNQSQTITQQNPLHIDRLVGTPQANRANLQQLRGQLNTSQIHQQLLQQRIQQNQQNVQRASGRQLTIQQQQQLMQQQLAQRNLQLMQNQQQLLNQQQNSNQLITQHTQLIQQNQAVIQQNQIINQQAQNQLIGQLPQGQMVGQQQPSQQPNPSQLMAQQTQNQLSNQQQNQNQMMNNQQSQSQLINQPQSPIMTQQQRQLISQQQRQNQLLNQQQQNQVISQQNQGGLLAQQSQNQLLNQQHLQNQLLNQQVQGQPINQQNQNQLVNQQQEQIQLLTQDRDQNNVLLQQQNPNNLVAQQGQQQPQEQLISNQLITQQSQQGHDQLLNQQNQNILINQQNQLMVQQQSQGPLMNQQNQIMNPTSQLVNQQGQQILNQTSQSQQLLSGQQPQQGLIQTQHLGQLNNQQIQQLQQLKREQQQLLNQNQQIVNQNQQVRAQNQMQMKLNQANQLSMQNRTLQQQNVNPNQNFGQHLLQQKPLFSQQQMVTSQQQQQILQNPNLAGGIQSQQPPFVGQGFNQQPIEAIQQQKTPLPQMNQQSLNQMNVQVLNQQLNTQNLGQQLNQQQLHQQNLQQSNMSPTSIGQQLGLDQGLVQQQQQQQQQQLNGGLPNQQQQINPQLNQQVVRSQFQQGNMINQQVLANQQQQRPQINQQLWAQGQQQQQQGQLQGQQAIHRPVGVVQQSPTGTGPRVQWPPGQQQGIPQRQFIQLDAHTHNQLQKMPPEQQALFVARLQKQRQLQLAKQMQQRGSGHILIRGNVPPGLTTQQQVQWLQQQAKQQGIVLPPNIQQNITPGTITQQNPPPANVQHTPGLSPINQGPTAGQQFVDQNQQQQHQLQLRQYRLQQLQLQREQAQKTHLTQQGAIPQQAAVRPPNQPPSADSTTSPAQVQVNPKTKTALANMLSIKLQSGGTIGGPRQETIPEPSAAGTLRMMTAQHNAAINSKPQEIIALQQRRVINGPNGEIIKTPVPQLPSTPPNEPPKLQYSQKPPLPVQHRVGPFYGHNPNLKLPPDLFLLGCIFVVVEIEDFLEERLPGWQQKIEKYGGEVEKQYGSKVTHVLCETQRHGVVMQALRDCKRCVTVRWLSDVIKRKQVLPPWTALHLPQIYFDIRPASKHLISISGFEGNIRNMIKQMIQYTGAKCTSYFSKHNTLLICAKVDGTKFTHAKKWGIPVVNVQWLTDVILGNFAALNQTENQAYQTYSSPPNMSFDPKLVPNMMHAWKAPINISQESYERVKRSASPVALPKPKKLKTERTDENDNISEAVANSDYRVLFSQFDGEGARELHRKVKELGGTVVTDTKDFTHLVMPRLVRSHKLLFAVCKNAHVVSEKWIEQSHAAKEFLPEITFNLPTEEFNKKYKVTIENTLQSFKREKLFEGKFFWVTPSVFPSKKIVAELIECCGGVVERIRRTKAQIEVTNSNSPLSYFILTTKHDLHLVADLLKNKKEKQKVVCNVELVLSAVLKQNLEVDPYAVSVL
ncbi:PAX-interacting protein 1-like [Cylas formicarius]|uniref:PAX-interacting protein 1-like n=1 Tax=Cylas formicarius TaxID=197179 RepID=UPI002958D525|nr:PAX-interacting protein 1-like [Cylas formicarius]